MSFIILSASLATLKKKHPLWQEIEWVIEMAFNFIDNKK